MRPNPMRTYAQRRCAYTAHLRRRCQRAEADAALLRAELAAERAAIRREREDAVARTESPEWARDLLVLARDTVRENLLGLADTHQACETCQGFGRGLSENFLQGDIDALTAAHDLPPEPRLRAPDWPKHMSFITRRGRRKEGRWLEPPKTASAPPAQPWRPPHWRDAQAGGLSGLSGGDW